MVGFIVTQPSSAQEATTEQPPTLEQEAFRTKLDGYLDSVKLMAPQMPNYDPASVSQLQEAQKLLAEIDGPQLQELKEVFELYPDAWRLLEVMDGYIEYGEYQANYQGGTGSLTEFLSNLVEIPFQANCRSVRRSRHPVDLATL